MSKWRMPGTLTPPTNGQHSEPLIVAHSSDLHLGGRTHRASGDHRELSVLGAVLDAASAAHARALILAGDVFDSNRVPDDVVSAAAELLFWAPFDVVVLPGNHDPATADSVYRRPALAAVPNLHVLGVNVGGVVPLPSLDLEISGAAHLSYADMSPLPLPSARTLRWRVIVAHGHWFTGPHDAHRGWLMHDHELAALDADYVALGHWERHERAGDGTVHAYYSGSPELARTLNVVAFSAVGVDVQRRDLAL
jgi:DNA repair exonuclease SbcCD nuclease subunit